MKSSIAAVKRETETILKKHGLLTEDVSMSHSSTSLEVSFYRRGKTFAEWNFTVELGHVTNIKLSNDAYYTVEPSVKMYGEITVISLALAKAYHDLMIGQMR
jgi:hypothetical protein